MFPTENIIENQMLFVWQERYWAKLTIAHWYMFQIPEVLSTLICPLSYYHQMLLITKSIKSTCLRWIVKLGITKIHFFPDVTIVSSIAIEFSTIASIWLLSKTMRYHDESMGRAVVYTNSTCVIVCLNTLMSLTLPVIFWV